MDFPTQTQNRLETLANHVVDYVDTRWDLLVLNFTEKGVGVISGVVAGLVASFFGFIALIFAGVGAAKWLGIYMNNPIVGYFIVAGVSLLFLIIAFTAGRSYIRNAVVKFVLITLREGEQNN
jgi:hypothetical protein